MPEGCNNRTMDYFKLIEHRHSVRAYLSKPVPYEAVQAILAAANQAPSAGNLQAYEIYLVTESSQRAALAQATRGKNSWPRYPSCWFSAPTQNALLNDMASVDQTCMQCKTPRSPAHLPCWRQPRWDWRLFGWERLMRNLCIVRSMQIRITCRSLSSPSVTRPKCLAQLRDGLSLTWCTSQRISTPNIPFFAPSLNEMR